MPRMTEKDIEDEIIKTWNAYNKCEQPDHNPKAKPVDIFDLIFNIDTPLTND